MLITCACLCIDGNEVHVISSDTRMYIGIFTSVLLFTLIDNQGCQAPGKGYLHNESVTLSTQTCATLAAAVGHRTNQQRLRKIIAWAKCRLFWPATITRELLFEHCADHS